MQGMATFKKKKFESPPALPHMRVGRTGKDQKKTVIFDLDETLIHCMNEENSQFYPDQHRIFLETKNNIVPFSVNIRPHAKEVLMRLSKHFNLAVFTAGEETYAEKVLELLDAEKKLFHDRYYRNHCYKNFCEENIKDLRIFGESLENMVIIDNSFQAFSFQKNNGIPIIPFTDDQEDDQLLKLERFLINTLNSSSSS